LTNDAKHLFVEMHGESPAHFFFALLTKVERRGDHTSLVLVRLEGGGGGLLLGRGKGGSAGDEGGKDTGGLHGGAVIAAVEERLVGSPKGL